MHTQRGVAPSSASSGFSLPSTPLLGPTPPSPRRTWRKPSIAAWRTSGHSSRRTRGGRMRPRGQAAAGRPRARPRRRRTRRLHHGEDGDRALRSPCERCLPRDRSSKEDSSSSRGCLPERLLRLPLPHGPRRRPGTARDDRGTPDGRLRSASGKERPGDPEADGGSRPLARRGAARGARGVELHRRSYESKNRYDNSNTQFASSPRRRGEEGDRRARRRLEGRSRSTSSRTRTTPGDPLGMASTSSGPPAPGTEAVRG